MTAHAQLLQLRRTLALGLVARAILVGTTVGFALFTAARLLLLPAWSVAIAAVGGAGVTALLLLRLRALNSLSRVALWVEERTPSLRYSLVTIAGGVQSPSLEEQALSVPWWTIA